MEEPTLHTEQQQEAHAKTTVIRAAREFSVGYDEHLIADLKENQAVASVWFD
jgi:hypothetical protein